MTAGVEKIGRYQVLEEVGRGAMGVVYKAQDPAIGRQIAVKSIRLNEMTDPAERDRLRDRLFREAQSAGILSHPGIVTIYDIAEENGLAYIFMEFVNGPSLEKLLASDQPPDKDSLLSIFRQTAAALDYAHKKGIVHRDIKPANIVLCELDGVPDVAKLVDFGLVTALPPVGRLSVDGPVIGTPRYVAPEMLGAEARVTPATDFYALGLVAFYLLTGRHAFDGPGCAEILLKQQREAAPSLVELGVPRDLSTVVAWCLEKAPADRPADASALRAALARCADAARWDAEAAHRWWQDWRTSVSSHAAVATSR